MLVPPTKMLDAFGKLVDAEPQLFTHLKPVCFTVPFAPFVVDNTIVYNNYLSLMREGVFAGMREVLNSGTATALGMLLKKSQAIIIDDDRNDRRQWVKNNLNYWQSWSRKRYHSNPDFNFRNNKFYTIYLLLKRASEAKRAISEWDYRVHWAFGIV